MRIFDREPRDWRELQDLVAQLFLEIGCDVNVGERVSLVRGEKEIDVAVRDPLTTPPSIYLCECKFWNKRIPQEVIHAFRTVIADFGAHRGFIISRVGFQAGAEEAVANTNLDLLTFDELQSLFFDRWRVAMGRKYRADADRLFPYWDYPGKMPKIKWEKEHVDRQQLLIEAYRTLLRIGPLFELEGSVWDLPMTLPRLDENGNAEGTITLSTYREVYDFIERSKDNALMQFQVLYGEIDA
jgi:Restriction endonuclease